MFDVDAGYRNSFVLIIINLLTNLAAYKMDFRDAIVMQQIYIYDVNMLKNFHIVRSMELILSCFPSLITNGSKNTHEQFYGKLIIT